MQLWNDYEGKTIAEIYSLGALLRPEGRSALFALRDGAEGPAIIRLTEAINDEGSMLACWRRVTEVKQENLVRIKRFGQTTFEGTPLTYAVMELTDANLADLLKERPLTYPEAMQVATSVVAALTALHEKGLIHEHIEAANVLAAGETVKLRTDCVRECVADPEHTTAAECQELVQRDVQDLSRLLLQALTLEKKISPTTKLPAPFDRIIPNGINGTWGLPEISAALTPPTVKPLVPGSVTNPRNVASPLKPAMPRSESVPAIPQESALLDSAFRHGQRRFDDEIVTAKPNVRLWASAAAVVLLVVAVLVYFTKGKTATPPSDATAPQATASQVAAPSTTASEPVAPQAAVSQAASNGPAAREAVPTLPSHGQAVAAPMQAGWYVIAYTFNQQEQALKRATAITERHPSIHTRVIAPNGHAPYLIAIGGAMSRAEAESVRNSARREGMPRDTYIRNYKGN